MSEKTLKFGLLFGFKYFIGYKEGEILKQLCIILPQMTGYIKYCENEGKNMSFITKMMMCWINTMKLGQDQGGTKH